MRFGYNLITHLCRMGKTAFFRVQSVAGAQTRLSNDGSSCFLSFVASGFGEEPYPSWTDFGLQNSLHFDSHCRQPYAAYNICL